MSGMKLASFFLLARRPPHAPWLWSTVGLMLVLGTLVDALVLLVPPGSGFEMRPLIASLNLGLALVGTALIGFRFGLLLVLTGWLGLWFFVTPGAFLSLLAIPVWVALVLLTDHAVRSALVTVQQLEREQAKNLVQEFRGEFAKVASHELRTPLAVILGMADTLKRIGPQLDAPQRDRMLEEISLAAVRLAEVPGLLEDGGSHWDGADAVFSKLDEG